MCIRDSIRRACNAVLEYEHFEAPAEISVTFVDNAAIAELNNQDVYKRQGLAGLCAGVEWILAQGVETLCAKETALAALFYKNIRDCLLYTSRCV